MSFKDNLIDELSYQGYKLKDFARCLNIPYPTFLSYVGKKSHLPNIEVGTRIAQKLNVSVEQLVTGKKAIYRDEFASYKGLNEAITKLINLPHKAYSDILRLIDTIYSITN